MCSGISDKINRGVTLDELDKFVELAFAREILGQRFAGGKFMESTWAFPMFKNTLSRQKFRKIMRLLCFDVKSDRR